MSLSLMVMMMIHDKLGDIQLTGMYLVAWKWIFPWRDVSVSIGLHHDSRNFSTSRAGFLLDVMDTD